MCWMGTNQSKNTGSLSLNSDLFRYQVIGELVQEKKKLCQESYLNVEIDGVCKVSFTLTNRGTLLLDAKTTNSAPICMNGI